MSLAATFKIAHAVAMSTIPTSVPTKIQPNLSSSVQKLLAVDDATASAEFRKKASVKALSKWCLRVLNVRQENPRVRQRQVKCVQMLK